MSSALVVHDPTLELTSFEGDDGGEEEDLQIPSGQRRGAWRPRPCVRKRQFSTTPTSRSTSSRGLSRSQPHCARHRLDSICDPFSSLIFTSILSLYSSRLLRMPPFRTHAGWQSLTTLSDILFRNRLPDWWENLAQDPLHVIARRAFATCTTNLPL